MEEQHIVKLFFDNLFGPAGGIFAFGLIIGAFAMWRANLKMITPHIQKAHQVQIEALEKMHAARLEAMNLKIQLLEQRISNLEKTESAYHALLLQHAAPTLKPPPEAQ